MHYVRQFLYNEIWDSISVKCEKDRPQYGILHGGHHSLPAWNLTGPYQLGRPESCLLNNVETKGHALQMHFPGEKIACCVHGTQSNALLKCSRQRRESVCMSIPLSMDSVMVRRAISVDQPFLNPN